MAAFPRLYFSCLILKNSETGKPPFYLYFWRDAPFQIGIVLQTDLILFIWGNRVAPLIIPKGLRDRRRKLMSYHRSHVYKEHAEELRLC